MQRAMVVTQATTDQLCHQSTKYASCRRGEVVDSDGGPALLTLMELSNSSRTLAQSLRLLRYQCMLDYTAPQKLE